ncbi:ApaG domain-containing protein [Neorickettsia helminthoeca]|nr:ApaG domain [Neorickettsia helminthoeca]
MSLKSNITNKGSSVFIRPSTVYLGRYLIRETEYHFWSYTINMTNCSSEDVKIIECWAEVIDSRGMVTKVRSVDGVWNKIIKKNEALEYVTGVYLKSVSGVLRSWYEVEFLQSDFVLRINGELCSVDASFGDILQ